MTKSRRAASTGKAAEIATSSRPFVAALLDPAAQVLSREEIEHLFARDSGQSARPITPGGR
jgi:hypothetical protein